MRLGECEGGWMRERGMRERGKRQRERDQRDGNTHTEGGRKKEM